MRGQDIYIVGVGMTKFGRHLERSVKDLVRSAVTDAAKDAGCDPAHIQAAYFGNATQGHMEGQHCIRGQVSLLPLGLEGIPIVNVENACATASTALHLAVKDLRSGDSDLVIAIGAEKLFSADKAKTFSAFDSAWDIETRVESAANLRQLGDGVEPPPGSESDKPYSLFMDVYAAFCRYHIREYGLTQRQLAIVASKNRSHARHNEYAQFREPLSVDDVLGAPPITYPLTLPMCSPISDGAAAAILCTGAAIDRYGLDRRRAVRVHASVLRTATARAYDRLDLHVTRLAAEAAYSRAGLGPEDIDFAEVHDATAMGEVIQTENLGFCPRGGGGELAESGATALGGRIPVNPSGGLESKGHPIGATGLGQIFEIVTQLRGESGPRQVENARLAIQENGGGLWGIEESVAHVGIFGRD
jgi:acetyl-CoA acetyltransferase